MNEARRLHHSFRKCSLGRGLPDFNATPGDMGDAWAGIVVCLRFLRFAGDYRSYLSFLSSRFASAMASGSSSSA